MSSNLVLERTIKAAQSATAAVIKAANELGALTATSEGLAHQIEDQEAKLAEVRAKNDTAFREGAAELRLKVKEDADKVLVELLESRGLAMIKTAEVASLTKDLEAALAKGDADIKAAVAVAVAAAQRDAKAAAQTAESNYKVETAAKDATIEQQKAQLGFMSQQVVDLRKQIDDERATRLAIAQADAQRQGTIVNTGK